MYLKIFFIFSACLQFAVSETYDKVNLTYAYETLCPFCLQFDEEQFYAGYPKLADYINLELLPVVHSIDETGVTCIHGDNECFITRAQVCAYKRPGVTEAIRVKFLQCTEAKAFQGEDVVDADIEACVNSVLANIVSYDTVQTCMNSEEESTALIKEFDDIANTYGIKFVPWLGYFGVYNSTEEQHLRRDFVKAICQKLTNPPDVCN